MVAFYTTCIIFILFVLGAVAWLAGFNILKFIRYIKEELLIVLGTSSSESVLPRMIAKMEHLGCEQSVVGLVIPTGYSFNLDGTCIYLTMAALFLAQATGTELSFAQQLGIIAILLLTSKGAAGVTGAGFIVLAATLSSVGTIPVASIALILGVDRFMSEARALTNLIGNGVATVVVSRWEGELDVARMHAELNGRSRRCGPRCARRRSERALRSGELSWTVACHAQAAGPFFLHDPPADPKPDILARRDVIVAALRALLPADAVIAEPLRLKPYETDGLAAYRQPPLAVVLPDTTEQVAAVMRYCQPKGVRVVPRGAGTSLSGGALPMADAVVVGLMRMNRILDIDYTDRCATVQAGVTNIGITNAVQERGFFYAPDPSSQLACMIGGNVNMNSGGAHCLKYGVTANNLLGLKLVTVAGEILSIGGAHLDAAGYDWLGLLTGSEGQLAMITEVTVRILRSPGRCAGDAGGLPLQRGRRRMRGCDHLVGHHPRSAGVHGSAGDPCLRGVRPRRLSAGCRGDADHRGGGQRGGTGRPAGAHPRHL